jgi:hypothetical protein
MRTNRAAAGGPARGGLLLAALAAGPATAADLASPTVSALPWRSGSVGGGFPCLAQLRGRPLDAFTFFVDHTSFAAMVRQTTSGNMRTLAAKAPAWVVSLPLLPSSNRSQFAQCAAGQFDGTFRQIGAGLAKAGAQGTVVRLGWEANIGSDSHPWGVDSAAQVTVYKACWRRAAAALKAGGPGLLVEWTSAKKTNNRALSIAAMYPGDDAVDVVGVHYYDSGPEKNTQAVWDQYYGATFGGNPWGLGTWLAFARSHGKRLGIAEWGLWRRDGLSAAQADDPVYIANMYQFFRANAGSIAYETYFNAMADQHLLCPTTQFPRATATYKALWHAGT